MTPAYPLAPGENKLKTEAAQQPKAKSSTWYSAPFSKYFGLALMYREGHPYVALELHYCVISVNGRIYMRHASISHEAAK